METLAKGLAILALALSMQACLATKIVTVPVKVAYGTTKAVVKGSAAVVEAAILDHDEAGKN